MKNPNWRKCILNADSKEIIKRIPDNSIDLILTDPPYNLGQHSTGNIPLPGRSPMNNDVADWDMVDFNPEEWADEFIRILKPTGNLFIFTSYNQLGRWYNCLDHKFDTSNFMIWHKTNPAPKIFKAGFLNSCEMIFTCWNKKHTWNFISQAEMHNFIESPICMRPERLKEPKHPAQKPVSILKKMIEIASNKGDIVFDPFMGVGSTGVASLELERRFIGVEIDRRYFGAAKERIENVMGNEDGGKFVAAADECVEGRACEPSVAYRLQQWQPDDCFREFVKLEAGEVKSPGQDRLAPIVKWPGGKEKELKYILPDLPEFNRYFEPFVGGGSVFMAVKAKEYVINDFSSELISLYRYISTSDERFFEYVEMMDRSWTNARRFFDANRGLVDAYLKYRSGELNADGLKLFVRDFCVEKEAEIMDIVGDEFAVLSSALLPEMQTNLCRKMLRMRKLEMEKRELPAEDVLDNIETAIKSAVYMNYRFMYNSSLITDRPLKTALFFFMRNYAYSGMFRYSSKGEFNVPYGGIAYNRKSLTKKLDYYKSSPVVNRFANTQIFNLDFEDFLNECAPSANDFIFLDPPYDTEFSTYAQNAFTRDDQQRLADYLINRCRAKWMMIIKNTEFIYSLYNRDNIKIRTFDKEYLVSFMNRNEKRVTHLLITNY